MYIDIAHCILPFRPNIFTLYGKREIFGTWLFPCHMYMSGIVPLYMRGSLISRPVIALCVCHRLSCAGIQWIQTTSSSRRIRHSQRVEKHCHLAPAHTAHPLHVSQPWIHRRLCDSKVQKRKGRTELTFLFSPSTNMRMCISQLLHDLSQISGDTPTAQLSTKQLGS